MDDVSCTPLKLCLLEACDRGNVFVDCTIMTLMIDELIRYFIDGFCKLFYFCRGLVWAINFFIIGPRFGNQLSIALRAEISYGDFMSPFEAYQIHVEIIHHVPMTICSQVNSNNFHHELIFTLYD